MGLLLKQSTAITVQIGPFVDEDDGKTAETGLAITQADVRLSKNGGNMAQKNDANACVHDEIGYYACQLDATDTGTLGRLQLMVHESGALPVYHEYMVVTANHYDSQCSTDYKQVDLIQMGGVSQSGTDLKDFADAGYDPATHKVQGLVLADTTTTNTDLTAFAANYTAARAGYLDELAAANLPTDVAAVKTDTGNIVTDTNELQTDWTNGGRLDNILDARAAEATVAALNDIAAADVWTVAMEGALTAKEQMNINHAVLAGKSSGGGTATIKFRDAADGKDRVSATVDADGNRTAIVNDGA